MLWYLQLKQNDKRVFKHTGRCVGTHIRGAVRTCIHDKYSQYCGNSRVRTLPSATWPSHPYCSRTADLLARSPSAPLHPLETIFTTNYPNSTPSHVSTRHYSPAPTAPQHSSSYPGTAQRRWAASQEWLLQCWAAAEARDKTEWFKTSTELYNLASEVLKPGLCRSGTFLKGPVFGAEWKICMELTWILSRRNPTHPARTKAACIP